MKILYAIQGTGNGHLSRARDIIPALEKKGELDILVSGVQADVSLPFPIKYKLKGLSFIFGKKGGVDLWETYRNCDSKSLLNEIRTLPVENYDIVINDFEPVSAWACFLKNKTCVSLCHQAAVLNKNTPEPSNTDPAGKFILKSYAPSKAQYGFHFLKYDSNIFTPVIRQQIRSVTPQNLGHYTVYLPAYSDRKIIKVLSAFGHVRWEVFSKHNKSFYKENNISIFPINNEAFVKSMTSSAGVLCGAGFETPAEALFLKKKLMVIPMKNQYEQQCNAAALKSIGVPVIKKLKKKHSPAIEKWLNSEERIEVNYPDQTEEIINLILDNHAVAQPEPIVKPQITFTQLQNLLLKKLLA